MRAAPTSSSSERAAAGGKAATGDEPATGGSEAPACLAGYHETENDAKTEAGERCHGIGNPAPGWVARPGPRYPYAGRYVLLTSWSNLSDGSHDAILMGRGESGHCMCCERTVSPPVLGSWC